MENQEKTTETYRPEFECLGDLVNSLKKEGIETNEMEVLSNALGLFNWFLDQKKEGNSIGVIDKSGKLRVIKNIKFFTL